MTATRQPVQTLRQPFEMHGSLWRSLALRAEEAYVSQDATYHPNTGASQGAVGGGQGRHQDLGWGSPGCSTTAGSNRGLAGHHYRGQTITRMILSVSEGY
jgi:hypothetical protein